jgi:AcrR family transcriptional regulator
MDYAIISHMGGASSQIRTDGRVQRSERSREAIVGAMLELIGEGILQPTAQQVAERADLGVRTVFRHFSDMDTLFQTIDDELRQKATLLFVEMPQQGSRTERIDGLIARRIEIFTLLGPYMRASAIQRWRSAFLQQAYERSLRVFRRDLQRWLPEVEVADPAIVDAVELALSFEAWDRLRTTQKLGVRRTANALRRMVVTLMACLEPERARERAPAEEDR